MVIPVWFNDSKEGSDKFINSGSKENVRSDIQKAYFGTNEETGWRSVKTYYEEESHGALTLTGTVSEWYSVNHPYTYYSTNSSRTASLVESATTWYFNNHSDSRMNYDKDHDGYLDSVMLIYAAPDYYSLEKYSYSNLWAYCYGVDEPQKNYSEPGANVFFWASYDFMYDESTSLQRTGKTDYGGGDNSHCNLDTHTYIHEMGHVFGLEDYYDYSNNGYKPAGGFSMQDFNVGGHDPFSSYALGWGSAYIPTKTTTIDLKPFQESGEMILLSPAPNSSNSPFDEYLLLEYYTPTGLNKFDCDYQYSSSSYPKGPKTSGIRVWHVDARLANCEYNYSTGDFDFTLTTNLPSSSNRVVMAMSNTSDDGEVSDGYLSPLGSDYYDFNILQLIRKDTSFSYTSILQRTFSADDLFITGNTFTMSTYKRQFVKSGKLNSNVDLGYSFTVNSTNANRASITVTKL